MALTNESVENEFLTRPMSDCSPRGEQVVTYTLMERLFHTDKLTLSTATRPNRPDAQQRRPFVVSEVERWVSAAMTRATFGPDEDGDWIGEVPGIVGPWIDAPTEDAARGQLPDVLFDWAMLKMADGDDDIPVEGRVNLNPH